MIPHLRPDLARATSTRVLASLALAVAASAAGALSLAITGPTDPEPPSNAAFLDPDRTDELVASTTDLVTKLFSVDPSRRAAAGRRARAHLTPGAQQQFSDLYSAYLSENAADVALRTSPIAVGVVSMSDDDATVLVVADQTASAADGRSNHGTAELRLHLVVDDHHWKIAKIEVV